MHIVSRRANEGIVIGREIQVTVLEIGSNWVEIEIRSNRDGDSRIVQLSLPEHGEGVGKDCEELELALV